MKTTIAMSLAVMLLCTACATPPASAPAASSPPLAERWAQLRAQQPKLRQRDAAQQLGVAEAQLLATEVGRQAVRLQGGEQSFQDMLDRLPELGRIRTITRNAHAVLERSGTVTPTKRNEEGRVTPGTGLIGGAIDLRPAVPKWGSAFAVTQPGRDGKLRRSLQFFDRHGESVLKIYLDGDGKIAAFDKLVTDFKAPDQPTILAVEAPSAAGPVIVNPNPSEADVKELRRAWHELTDVHQFRRMLDDLKLTREQALQLIGPDSAQRIPPQAAAALIGAAHRQRQPIMVFVGNRGMLQIYSGPVERPSTSGEWFNVHAPDFNLHLRQGALDHGWVVRRPTDHGIVTSVEFYDAHGNMLVNLFSRRARDKEETLRWRNIVADLPRS